MCAVPRVEHTQIFINNSFVDSVSGRTFQTINPSDETVIARIAEADRSAHSSVPILLGHPDTDL